MKNGKGDRLPTPSQIKAAQKQLEKELRATGFFQAFSKRSFYLPQEFCSWQKFLFSISAYHFKVFCDRISQYPSADEWMASFSLEQRCTLGFLMELFKTHSTTFPVYCLNKQIANAFLQTDLPPIFQLKRSHHMGAIFIPDGLLESPDKEKVKWILFGHRQKGEPTIYDPDPEHCISPHPVYSEDILEVFLICNDYGKASYFLCDLEQSTPKCLSHNESLGEEKRKDFADKVQSLVIQSLFWLQSQEPQKVVIKSKGFSNPRPIAPNTPKMSLPRWIGKDYATKVQRIAANSPADPTAFQSSKCMHWRRGHYRMQPIGKERADVKQIWIEPMLIKSENVSSPASK